MAWSRILNLDNFQQFTAINLQSDLGHDKGPVVIANGVRIGVLWQLADGKLARNVIGGTKTSFTTASAAVAEQFRAAMVAQANFAPYLAQVAPTASFVGIDLQDLASASLPTFRSTGTALPGTSTGTEMPNEVAAVITLRTAKTGPQNRGRMYMPGIGTQAIGAGNTINATCMTALGNYPNSINAGMAAIGLTFSLIQPHRLDYTSPITGRHFPERPAQMAQITTWVVKDNHWDSQRRRGLK